jgi:hypothetical protein
VNKNSVSSNNNPGDSMKKPGLFLCIIIYLLVAAGILIVMAVNHPAPSKAFLVQYLESGAL